MNFRVIARTESSTEVETAIRKVLASISHSSRPANATRKLLYNNDTSNRLHHAVQISTTSWRLDAK